MAVYILDASAWIEFFQGTKKGDAVGHLLEEMKNEFITPDPVISEVFAWSLREKTIFPEHLDFIEGCSHRHEIYLNLWVEAARIRHDLRRTRPDFGIMDALLLAVQGVTGATIVTGDRHFKGMRKVRML